MESVWYYVVNGVQTGPVSLPELKDAAAAGKLSPGDLVWQEGTADWVPARTVGELFPATPPPPPQSIPAGPPQPTYSVSPPPANDPLPLPPTDGPEPLSLDDEPGRAPRARRARRSDAGGALNDMPDWIKLIPVFCRRALNPDPAQAAPVAEEEATLTRAGVMDATARKFAVWRRSVLFVAAVPCAFAAFFGLIGVIAMDKDEREPFSVFGMLLLYVQAFALFAVPAAAVLGALTYDRLATSTRWVLIGGLVSFVVPLGIAFVPSDWLLDLNRDGNMTVAQADMVRTGTGLLLGLTFYLTLMPTVLSLLPAVSRACVRVKLLVPASLVPGWGLITSIPLFVLFALATFVMVYHVAGNALLIIGLLLVIGAPLLYLVQFSLLTKPFGSPADQATLARTSLGVFALAVLGLLFVVVYMFTATFGGRAILGFDSEKSIVRPWTLDLHRTWIEYVGRALFLSVFFADILLRIALSVWREERAFAGTAPAEAFDRTMTGLGAAVLPRGSATVE